MQGDDFLVCEHLLACGLQVPCPLLWLSKKYRGTYFGGGRVSGQMAKRKTSRWKGRRLFGLIAAIMNVGEGREGRMFSSGTSDRTCGDVGGPGDQEGSVPFGTWVKEIQRRSVLAEKKDV
jgi:hypothetical protein